MRYWSVLLCAAAMGCNEAQKPAEVGARPAPHAPAAAPADRPAARIAAGEPDNTAVNERDRQANAKNPIDQDETRQDVKITADIRRHIVTAKMSTDAQNIKIITEKGKVTLRGPVDSEGEKERIRDFAVEVAGAGNVENLLDAKHLADNQK